MNAKAGNESSANAQERGRKNPSREDIAKRAYELFIARGAQHGQHDQDWLQAERELRGQRA